MSEIGKRLAVVRERAGFSQIPFAHELGVSQSAYKNYERGATAVPVSLIAKVCEDYQVSPAWLVLGIGAIPADTNGELLEGAVLAVEKFAIANDFALPPEKKAKLIRFVFEELISGRNFEDKELARLFDTAM